MPIDVKLLAVPEVNPIAPVIFRDARRCCALEPAAEVILSDKDRRRPRLRDVPAYFTKPSS